MKSDRPSLSAAQVFSFYWKQAASYPKYLAIILLTLPIAVLVGTYLPPLILANVLARLSAGDFVANQPWQSFGPYMVMYAALVLSNSLIFWRIVDFCVWKLEGRVQKQLAQSVFSSMMDKSANFHANTFSGSLVSKTNKLLTSYVRIADTTVFGTLLLFWGIVYTSIILLPRAPWYVLGLIILSVTYVAIAFFASKPVRAESARHASAESRQTGYLADTLTNVIAIKSFAGSKRENRAFDAVTDRTLGSMRRLMFAHQKQMIAFSAASGTISVISLVLAVISVVNFNANIATVFLIFNYTTTIVRELFQFSNNALRNYNRSVGDASDMIRILSEPIEIKDPENPIDASIVRGDIRFKDTTFTHKDSKSPIFSKLQLHIKPGEKVGLVGHSGSGKTSLTRILLRFSDIDSGSINIDGYDISKITQDNLRQSIAYVPQEPLLFHRSIAENIAYGRPEASQQEIEAIAKLAHAHDFIRELPKGYDTMVGERGVKLSGGQRQRVAIARAMLKNSPILVLDEATSALDSESELLIQDALWKLMEGRTAIVIAHRLSTIQKMDRIIVMDKGQIVEEGSHKELLRMNGIYANLWNHQSGGFLE